MGTLGVVEIIAPAVPGAVIIPAPIVIAGVVDRALFDRRLGLSATTQAAKPSAGVRRERKPAIGLLGSALIGQCLHVGVTASQGALTCRRCVQSCRGLLRKPLIGTNTLERPVPVGVLYTLLLGGTSGSHRARHIGRLSAVQGSKARPVSRIGRIAKLADLALQRLLLASVGSLHRSGRLRFKFLGAIDRDGLLPQLLQERGNFVLVGLPLLLCDTHQSVVVQTGGTSGLASRPPPPPPPPPPPQKNPFFRGGAPPHPHPLERKNTSPPPPPIPPP